MSPQVDRRVTQLLLRTTLITRQEVETIYFMPFRVRKVFVDLCRLGQVWNDSCGVAISSGIDTLHNSPALPFRRRTYIELY